MKQNYFLLLLLYSQLFFSQIINFPDANFKARLLQSSSTNYIAADLNGNATKIDQNNDGQIDVSEALNISKISISGDSSPTSYVLNYNFLPSYNISSLDGINNFKNLKILECKNNNLTILDFKDLINLEQVYCHHNKITEFLNFNDVNKLYIIKCTDNLLTNLDFSQSARNIEAYSQYYDNNNSVLYFYSYNNPLINVNIQNGKSTIWMILSEWGSCAFGELFFSFNTCGNYPSKMETLVNLKVNCFEVPNYQQYLSRNDMSINLIDNCLIATDEVTKIKLSVSPNPARDFLQLDFNEKIEKIQIIDESGRLVSFPRINQNRINISKLKSGVYYLNILSNGKQSNTKFVKQ